MTCPQTEAVASMYRVINGQPHGPPGGDARKESLLHSQDVVTSKTPSRQAHTAGNALPSMRGPCCMHAAQNPKQNQHKYQPPQPA